MINKKRISLALICGLTSTALSLSNFHKADTFLREAIYNSSEQKEELLTENVSNSAKYNIFGTGFLLAGGISVLYSLYGRRKK